MIGPVSHGDQNRGCAGEGIRPEQLERLAELRVVQVRERRLAELERLLEPGDELVLAGRGVGRSVLRRRDAGDLAAEEIVPLVGEVGLDLGEAHLRRRGAIGALGRGHRFGCGDQDARIALLRGAHRVGDRIGRRCRRPLSGKGLGENGERDHQDQGSGLHGALQFEEAGCCPNCACGASLRRAAFPSRRSRRNVYNRLTTMAGGHVYKSLLLAINTLCTAIVWAQSPASSPAASPPSAQSKLSVHWEELTAADFRDAIARAQGTCLLPFGILEKHGLHLPLGNDLLNVRYVALNAAQQEYAIVFPEYYFGQIFEAKHQPGTVAYSRGLELQLLQETTDEMARNGCKKIIIVNGHGGNNSLLPYFAQSQTLTPHAYSVYVVCITRTGQGAPTPKSDPAD